MRLGPSSVLGAFVLLFALVFCASPAQGAALTTKIDSHEKSCYYAWVDQVGEKVGFYYAVQSGGDFRVAYSVHDPNDKSILEEPSARQLDIIFTGNTVGEYVFCFYNGPDDKLIDFDITVESEPRLELPISEGHVVADHTAPMEESLSSLQGQLTAIERTQRFFRTRENRNYDTVKNTQSRIFWYSLFESAVIVGMSLAQVGVVRFLFNRNDTKRFRV